MYRKKFHKIFAYCGVSLFAISFAQTAVALPIEEAVRTALQTNPDIGIVIEGQRAIEQELNQARSRYYPTIDLSLGAGHEYTNDPSTRGAASLNGGAKFATMNRYESRLSLSQILYDGNATKNEVERQKSRVTAASRRVRDTAQTIALDAVQAYLEARRQRELFKLNEENVQMHKETLDLVSLKLSGGAATIADQQQAASRLAQAETVLEDARARLRDADATYSRVIGESPRDLQRPDAPFWAMPQSVDEAIDWAIESNPTVAVTKADLDTSIREFDTSKSDFFPTIRLEVGADANRHVDGTRGNDYNIEAMIRMNYNLFRGGEDYYRRQEFLYRIAEARQTYNREIRLTEEAMRLSWNARDSAVERVRAQRREVEANNLVRQTYRQQFDLGGRSLLELLDAENEYFFASTNLITTEFQAVFSIYQVLANGGVLISALSLQPPVESATEYDSIEPRQANFDLKDSYPKNVDPILGADVISPLPGLSEEGEILDPTQLDDLLEQGDDDSLLLDPNLDDLLIEEGEDSSKGLLLDPQTDGVSNDFLPKEDVQILPVLPRKEIEKELLGEEIHNNNTEEQVVTDSMSSGVQKASSVQREKLPVVHFGYFN